MVGKSFKALILLGAVSLPSLAHAQLTSPAPVRQSVDANGVDLFAGTMNVKAPVVSIGGGRGQGLAYYHINTGSGWADNITAALNENGNAVTVRLGGKTDAFTDNGGGNFTSTQGNGATLTVSGSIYTYTTSDGTVARFSADKAGTAPYYANLGRAIDITRPSGMKLSYSYQQTQICTRSKQGGNGQICTQHGYIYRLTSVTNSYGYGIGFAYQSDDTGEFPDSGASGLNLVPWSTVASVVLSNLQNYNAGQYGQSTSHTPTTFTVTDAMNRATNYRMTDDGARVAGITRPGASSESVTVGYDGNNRVSSVASAAGTWSYGYQDNGNARTVTVTAPSNVATTYVFDIPSQRMTQMTDGLNNVTRWSYDSSGRLLTATAPEGNSVTYTYDNGVSGGRGNVTDTTYTPKPNSGLGQIATHANYDTTCTNAATCNSPHWTRDANGNQTDYQYDPTHGGVTVVTAPAGANGVRPEMRYGYTSYSDYFGGTIWRQTSSSSCRTTAGNGCGGGGDEVVTSTNYGSLSGNNYLPLSMTKRAGDSSVSATVSTAYDAFGNVTSTTDPVGAVTSYAYDADRELTETIGADPDGGGPLKPRAVRNTYNADGTVAQTEVGTDTGGNFQSLQQVSYGYDGYGRKVQANATAGGTTYGVTQWGYDGMGRLQCTTTRMNAAAFGSLPGACTLGSQGSDGPDRITLNDYDELSRIKAVTSGYGTNVAAYSARATYTPNGKTQSATDANGNVTSYGYDGLDRLSTTTYPGGSSDGQGYDANGNVTSRSLRDGNSYNPSYDALGNLTNDGQGHSFAYDNLGELTSANDTNNAYENFGWDALGRKTSETAALGGTASMSYDAAGRRTRLTWADGFYVTYNYDLLGEMTGIYESGATALVSFAYDDLGRRTWLYRGNNTSSNYVYDGAGRLATLTFYGSNQGNTFGYSYSAGGQITSRTMSNDAYAWTGAVTTDRPYGVNGLNQYTQSGSVTPTYDGRGNLTSAGNTNYSYNLNNQLTNFSGGYIYRNALGEWLDVNTEQQWMVYDGDRTIEEYGYDHTIKRRYVYGPGGDEPLIWYEGSGTNDRRYLHADERGSIVAVTDNGGNVSAINTYDEFGIPGANNQGRFQYTGQRWIPALGMYDYKARMYSPTLGRFLQTDPIGYSDGMNWYNYVGGDPVNQRDYFGLSKDDDDVVVTASRNDDVVVTARRDSDTGGTATYLPWSGPSETRDQQPQLGDVVVTGTRETKSQNNQTPRAGDVVVTGRRIAAQVGPIIGPMIEPFLPHIGPLVLPNPLCACFEAGTLVATVKGLDVIENIKIGDLVLSKEDATGKIASKKVTSLVRPAPKPVYELAVRDVSGKVEIFYVTGDHRWKVDPEGWTATDHLKIGNRIETDTKADVAVISVSLTSRVDRTYNLVVADWHTFMVGKDHIIVHNGGPCDQVPNVIQNKQAADARRQAERMTGKTFTREQQRQFHDRITGQGYDYQMLVEEAVEILNGR